MAVINIRKDGTIVKDMSNVTVPKEIMESIAAIAAQKGEKNGKSDLRRTGNN